MEQCNHYDYIVIQFSNLKYEKQVAKKNAIREVTIRFLEVLDELVERQSVESLRIICQKLDYQQQNLSKMRMGTRDVTIQLIIKLWHVFGGNPVYIIFGDGPKILEGNSLPVIPKNSVSLDSIVVERKYVKRLEDLVDSKIEIIALLKKEVERLTIELGTKGK